MILSSTLACAVAKHKCTVLHSLHHFYQFCVHLTSSGRDCIRGEHVRAGWSPSPAGGAKSRRFLLQRRNYSISRQERVPSSSSRSRATDGQSLRHGPTTASRCFILEVRNISHGPQVRALFRCLDLFTCDEEMVISNYCKLYLATVQATDYY